jgi:hypothetical protein
VRDSETYSQQFLTPSIVEGIRQKLGVSAIARHKLTYSSISLQQERTQSRGWEDLRKTRTRIRPQSILTRGIMLCPIVHLAFDKITDAQMAVKQHICLCRNEDLLFPDGDVLSMDEREFDCLFGFELRFGRGDKSFLVGFNRFEEAKPMFGWIEITGNPVGISSK